MGGKNTPEYQAISGYRAELERQLSPHLSTISKKLRDIQLLTSEECDSIKAKGSNALVKKILFLVENDPVEKFIEFIHELNSITVESKSLKNFIDNIETKKKEGYRNLLSAKSAAASGQSYDVFISYGHQPKTNPIADRLSTLLTNEGLKVFIDRTSLQPGYPWPVEIADAIRTSKAFVAILTKKYVKSHYCHGELYEAKAIGKKLFPVVLETGWDQERAGMPIKEILGSIQYAVCNSDKEDHDEELRKLAKIIKDKIIPSEEKVETPLESPHKRSQELKGASASANQGVMKRATKIDPYTESLKLENIETIVSKLRKVWAKWFQLGKVLEVDYKALDLEDIEKEHRDNERCLREMIAHRLRSGTDLKPLTWKKICDSLRKPTVGGNDVAKEIETDLQSATENTPANTGEASSEKVETPMESPHKRSRELKGASASANQGVMKRATKIDPYTESLKLENIKTIVSKLDKVRAKWFQLGKALGVDFDALEDIEKKHRDNERCLREMIAHRLRSGTDLKPLTWKKICDSLRKPTVGGNDVAKEIETDLQSATENTPANTGEASSDDCEYKFMVASKDTFLIELKKGGAAEILEDSLYRDGLLSGHEHTTFLAYDGEKGQLLVDTLIDKVKTSPHFLYEIAHSLQQNKQSSYLIQTLKKSYEKYFEIEIIHWISLKVTNKSQSLEWEQYGLKVSIPDNSLCPGIQSCMLTIGISISRPFKPSKNHHVVSALYGFHLSNEVKLVKPLTISMQHNTNPKSGSDLRIFRASCKSVPCDFKELPTSTTLSGKCASSQYVSIEQKSFSWHYVGSQNAGDYYTAILFYRQQKSNLEICITITLNTGPYTIKVKNDYKQEGYEKKITLDCIEFEDSNIDLGIPLEWMDVTDGWKIRACKQSTLSKEQVNVYRKGQEIPCFHLEAKSTTHPPKCFDYAFTLKGIKENFSGNQFATLIPSTSTHQVLDASKESISLEKLKPQLKEIIKEYHTDLKSQEVIADIMEQLKNQKATLQTLQIELDKKGLKIDIENLKDRLEKVLVYFSSKYWNLSDNNQLNGEGVLVAVLDTGVNPDHNAFRRPWDTKLKEFPCAIKYKRNFMEGDPKNSQDNSSTCHGTAVAGIVAGTHQFFPDKQVTAQYRGFGDKKLPLGVAPKAFLVICKVSKEGPLVNPIIKALQWILAHNTVVMRLRGYKSIQSDHIKDCGICNVMTDDCDRQKLKICIVNMSFRLFECNADIEKCITSLNEQHVICVAGAGNDGNNVDPGYPALYENVLSVGAVNSSGVISDFSTRHPTRVDVYALGEDVLVAKNTPKDSSTSNTKTGIFGKKSGTSFATPAVSGLIAILVQCAREQGGEELAQQITHLNSLKMLMKKYLLHEMPELPNCTAYLLRPQNIEEFFIDKLNLKQKLQAWRQECDSPQTSEVESDPLQPFEVESDIREA